jgi:galactokinase
LIDINKKLDTIFSFLPGEPIRQFFAPGRVNLLGEHLDYNGGLVMPAPLSLGTHLFIKKRNDSQINFFTDDYTGDDSWVKYPQSVLDQIGEISQGFDAFFSGDLPQGAGLSSSASIEVVTARGIRELFDLKISDIELAKLSQRAENIGVGVACGIMDQFVASLGKENHALMLNCKDLSYEQIPFESDQYIFVIANTNFPRKLNNSEYNLRRGQCEKALSFYPEKYLVDVPLKDLHKISDPILFKRAQHVITENERVKKGAAALKSHDFKTFGILMNESHESLKKDYEVTNEALDTLVALAQNKDFVLGARMTGAGFGGCTVNLIEKDKLDNFCQQVGSEYFKKLNLKASFYTFDKIIE